MFPRLAKRLMLGTAASAAVCTTSLGFAGTVTYRADLQPLNNSGVSATAVAVHDDEADTLLVTIAASGLENQPHAQHIHGTFSGGTTGTPTDSEVPTLANDTDGDGFIEALEGAATYGPILLSLSSPPPQPGEMHAFPVASGGAYTFRETYDLNNDELFFDDLNNLDFEGEDLLPLDLRHIVIHGMSVAEGIGAGTPGEVDGTAGYKAVLPVANGEFFRDDNAVPIPLPPAALAALPVLAVVGGKSWLRRRKAMRP